MELEFDKEIDALLRGSRAGDSGVSTGEHVDADAAALFAEGLLPDTVRQAYVRHFAECSRCRKLLSGVIAMSSEGEEEAVAASVAAAPVAPDAGRVSWFSRLFAMPNLAFVMGGLILVFGGFIALQVLQNSGNGSTAGEVSQVAQQEPAGRGPDLGSENFNAAASASNASNAGTFSNTAANMAVSNANRPSTGADSNSSAAPTLDRIPESEAIKNEEAKKLQLGAVEAAPKPAISQPALAAPPPPPAAKTDEEREKPADDRRDAAAATRMRKESADAMTRTAEAQSMKDESRAGGPSKTAAGPSRNQQLQFPNSLGRANSVAATRRVSGKTFEYNDGVWYDSSYRGRPTTNVRRGTDDFRKLDEGLRSIANSISGTVVVVWKDRSYRID